MKFFFLLALCFSLTSAQVVFEGANGSGKGRNVVLVAGDDEYRSEEALPQLARILAARHGFRCTVLFAIDPADGSVDPAQKENIPGLEALDKADLIVLFVRFLDLPGEQLKHVADYVNSGRPIVALRTATHGFAPEKRAEYQQWHWKDPSGGFGRMFLGETWVGHHGGHGKQSTRGRIAPGKAEHPILRGIEDGAIWGPTDVYEAHPPDDVDVLLLGEVVAGMSPKDPPVDGPKNNPMMPVAWTRTYLSRSGGRGRVFTTTMGSSQDLENGAFRRLLVNACFWSLDMDVPNRANVDLVGEYRPTPFGFGKHQRGRKPQDF